ncbi:MAG: hypothetical protein OEW04_08935 [Nitrospirota bacterium]|nr:hypothetical protein [Nitrospirota bacterium]
MQRDFHYDIIFALAKEAGYTAAQANIIAYASQYVDDNTDREYAVADAYGEFYVGFPEKIGTSGDLFLPIITQAADITAFKLAIQRYVYAPFHFLPGDNNTEINGKKNPLCTTRGCRNAVDLLTGALKSRDLYGTGVALHVYADTWAHERFSAFHEDWNRVYKASLFKGLPPNIGHAEVYHKPDEISGVWVDKRFSSQKIDNRERAMLASEKIFGFLRKGKATWNDVKGAIEKIMSADDLSSRVKLIRDMYPQIENYDQDRWINEALLFGRNALEIPEPDVVSGTGPTRPRFVEIKIRDSNAHWFRFQAAAKKHLAGVLSSVRTL